MNTVLRQTEALCPVCRQRLAAAYISKEDGIYLQRICPLHGEFAIPVWRNRYDFTPWMGDAPILQAGENPSCPTGCGLCRDHLQGTCCVVLPITARCNLSCRHCFADPNQEADLPFEQIEAYLNQLAVPGQTLVQLSGGEPTLRDDLPEIVAAAKKAGCRYVQLNSNGLRLAEDEGLVKALAQAGLSFVFMQFDGLEDTIYQTLRQQPMREIKERAIANCARHNIGVTLVPTIVPGVNNHQVGEIIRYGVQHSPAVRGVHFQPVSYFGRSPVKPHLAQRYTLDELLYDIINQSGLIQFEDISPSRCDHPLCGLHGDFMVLPDYSLKPLHQNSGQAQSSCCGQEAAAKNRDFVGRRWQRQEANTPCCCCSPRQEPDFTDLEQFADRVQSHGFTITAMTFQDAATLDIARLRQCSLHVYDKGKHIPFCAYYL